jgi:hypothetical protein
MNFIKKCIAILPLLLIAAEITAQTTGKEKSSQPYVYSDGATQQPKPQATSQTKPQPAKTARATTDRTVGFGLKAGTDVSFVTGDIAIMESKEGFFGGVYARIPLGGKFSFQPELLYVMQGWKSSDDDSPKNTVKMNLDYIQLPLMFQWEAGTGFRIELGPQIGVLVSAKNKYEGISLNAKDVFNKFDAGANFGLSYEFYGFNIFTRYNLGLTNILDDETSVSVGLWEKKKAKVYNQVISFGLGYTF